jgi:hypothetical protein
MANEELDLWNRALYLVNAPRLSSTSETSSSKEIIDDVYPHLRKFFLSMHPWDGATTVADLTEDESVTKPDRWDHAWTLPSNFLQAWRVNDMSDGMGNQPYWEISVADTTTTPVKVLYTDTNSVRLEYSWDLDTDAKLALLGASPAEALAHMLALELARGWGKKEADIAVLERKVKLTVSEARLANGRQQKVKRDKDHPLLRARDSYVGRRTNPWV